MSAAGLISPDGRYRIALSSWEARMSHWIDTPSLIDTATSKEILGLSDGHWSLDRAHWLNETCVCWTLRKYPGNHQPASIDVTLDVAARQASFAQQTVSFDELESALERCLRWR